MTCHHFSRSAKAQHTRSEKVTHTPSPIKDYETHESDLHVHARVFVRRPSLEERPSCHAARVAYFATIALEYDRFIEQGTPNQFTWWQLVAMCNACGANTGNWCDHCEALGHH